MKVLWFCNTPALGIDYLYNKSKIKGTGGWLYSLNDAIQYDLELSVVFHHPYKVDNFKYNNTSYFPIYTGNIILENIKNRFLGKVYDDDFLEDYLKIVKEVKPDIIHIHGTENPFLCILDKVGIPIVISVQGNLTVYSHKFFSGFHGKYVNCKNDPINIKSIIFGRRSFKSGFNKMTKMAKIESFYLKNSKNIIGRTDWDRQITRILAPKSNYFVGNEILRDGFYEEKWNNIYENGKIILFTTNGDNYYKGFETLCHSLTLLNEIGIQVEWRIAGVSNNSLINKITKKQLSTNYPASGLVLLGSLNAKELIKNLKQSHLYIMGSHIENSPNNLCEAMILGMPCVATFAGGTASMIKAGEEGLLIQGGDPYAMAGAILELISDKSKSVLFGKRARERAFKRHNKENIIKKLLSTYNTIIRHTNED